MKRGGCVNCTFPERVWEHCSGCKCENTLGRCSVSADTFSELFYLFWQSEKIFEVDRDGWIFPPV